MKIVSASEVARGFARLLALVEAGETVTVQKHGRTVARLVPGSDFTDGRDAARRLQEWHKRQSGGAAADEITEALNQARQDEERKLALRLGRAD